MQNKKSLYILLPAALLLWAYIIYKIIVQSDSPKTKMLANESIKNNKSTAIISDSFTLDLNYRDPFLGNKVIDIPDPVIKPSQQKKGPATLVPIKEVIVRHVNWPVITYVGRITNVHSDKRVYMLNINGREHFVTKGEKLDGIIILETFSDSIRLELEGEIKTILK